MCVKNGRLYTYGRTIEGVLHVRNEAVSEKTLQIFWPSLPVEYVSSISGQTDVPEVRCGLTDRQTNPTTATLTVQVYRGLINTPSTLLIHNIHVHVHVYVHCECSNPIQGHTAKNSQLP